MNQTVIAQLKSHRSIRKFTSQPIADTLLRELIMAGQSAATSSNLQGVSVIRIISRQTRQALAALAGDQAYIEQAPEFLVFCADLHSARRCCQGNLVEGMTEHFMIATIDSALFAQNVVVAAESVGLGICYIGALRNDPQQVSELLALPRLVYPVFGLCLGYPDQQPQCKPRLPLDSVLMEDRYQDVDEALLAQYDQTMRDYYQQRTGGKVQRGWSQEMSALLSKESRSHMRAFLAQQGFTMR